MGTVKGTSRNGMTRMVRYDGAEKPREKQKPKPEAAKDNARKEAE